MTSYIADTFVEPTPPPPERPLTSTERIELELYREALQYIAQFSPGCPTGAPIFAAQAALRGAKWWEP